VSRSHQSGMSSWQRLRQWAFAHVGGATAIEPTLSSVVPVTPRGDRLQSAGSICIPLDGAWVIMDHLCTRSTWPKHMCFFIIQRGELVTASGKFRISKHRSRSEAYCCKDAIMELDANRVLRMFTAGGCKYYRRVEMPSEAELTSLQGHWVRNKRGYVQKYDTLAIQGPFWHGGPNKQDQGFVYAHPCDGSVMIRDEKVSVLSHDKLVLTTSGGRQKTFSKVFQPNLWRILEQ